MSLVGQGAGPDKEREAIQWFQKAIDKEAHGEMSDAVEYYRRAFKINDKVDALYRTKEVPIIAQRLQREGGKNTLKRVDEEKVKKINVDRMIAGFQDVEAEPIPPAVDVSEDGTEEPAKVAAPAVSPLIHLPKDIWVHILEILLETAPESWFTFAITCKKHAYLSLGTNDLWRKLCYLVYPKQVYQENQMVLARLGERGEDGDDTAGEHRDTAPESLPIPLDPLQTLVHYDNSWKTMLFNRPFVKFLGCYISVINYYSEGGKAEFSSSWTNPVRTITYYRYLRFYPDGKCVKALTHVEPPRVIPHMSQHNTSIATIDVSQGRPTISESQRIYHGTWTVSADGEVNVRIENGSSPHYVFHYSFQVKSVANFKHHKLSWNRYSAVRKSGHEDEGEETMFGIRNEKPFKFSRVRSYSLTN